MDAHAGVAPADPLLPRHIDGSATANARAGNGNGHVSGAQPAGAAVVSATATDLNASVAVDCTLYPCEPANGHGHSTGHGHGHAHGNGSASAPVGPVRPWHPNGSDACGWRVFRWVRNDTPHCNTACVWLRDARLQCGILGLVLVRAATTVVEILRDESAYALPDSASRWLSVVDLAVVSAFVAELCLKLCYLRWHFTHHPAELVDLALVLVSFVMMTSAAMHARFARFVALVVLSRVWRVVTLVNTCSKKRAARAAAAAAAAEQQRLNRQMEALAHENERLKRRLTKHGLTLSSEPGVKPDAALLSAPVPTPLPPPAPANASGGAAAAAAEPVPSNVRTPLLA